MTPQARVYYELSRLNALEDWWHYAMLLAIVGAVIGYVYWMYRRDWTELPRPLGWSLLILRVLAFTGLLLFFLDLQKRSEQPVVKPSRLAVLVDNSLSMTLPVGDMANESSQLNSPTVALDPQHPQESRIQQVQRAFTESELLKNLSEQHDVTVYQLGQEQRLAPIATFSKTGAIEELASAGPKETSWTWKGISTAIWFGTIIFIVGAVLIATAVIVRLRSKAPRQQGSRTSRSRLFSEHNPDKIAYAALAGVVMSILGFVFIATAAIRAEEYRFASLWSIDEPPKASADSQSEVDETSSSNTTITEAIDWSTKLTAQATETKVGDAIVAILAREQSAPLAGIVILTDGQNNAGLSLDSAGGQASAAGVPIYAIGLGSAVDAVNVRVVDMNAPRRVFPGDPIRIAATLQATGMEGKSVTVQLRRRSGSAQEGNNSSFAIEQETSIKLPAATEMAAVNFDVSPPAIGSYTYDVKILTPTQDTNKNDDSAESDVDVIEPKATVLIFAGGPTREYQFVRNLLFRDETIQSHVFLQTGGPGISQEADELLTEFPATSQEMAKYDCVLTFDADFMKLSRESVEVLEEWVSSGAGGLVLVAGSVATPEWAGSGGNTDPRAAMLRDLSPVVVNARGTRLVSLGRFESETVWPLKPTTESSGIDFLDIANSMEASAAAWQSFAGVYSFYAAYEPKPGATPLMLFTDPTATFDNKQPIYLASQFYGGGRVVFQGSGEMWRIREVDENYFNTYWTKLVRWTAQGRLLRDSDYGLLLVDKEEGLLGEQISVRAVLKDQQFRPLTVPNVTSNLIDPTGKLTPLQLNELPGTGQAGVYVGQFLLRQSGKYQVRLDTRITADSILTRQVNSRVPTLEIERPKRDDEALASIVNQSGGFYYAGVKNAIAGQLYPSAASINTVNSTTSEGANIAETAIAKCILPRDQVTFLPGAPDRAFQERWMLILMMAIAGALSLEWLLRRLSRLA